MNRPLVSVITNSYNSDKYLRANIESMLRQDYVDWEHIVVDCGSTDHSMDILSVEAHDRLRVVQVPFCGVAKSRNIGIAKAKGDIIAILDSDDYSLAQRLTKQVNMLLVRPDIVGVGSGIVRMNETTNKSKTYVYPSCPRQIGILLRAGFNPIPHSSFTFRRSSFEATGGYSDTIEKGEDFDLLLRFAASGSLCSLPIPLVHITAREDSHTNRHRPKGRDTSFFKALSLILNSIGEGAVRPPQEMVEMWLESIGSDGVGALLGGWCLRSIHHNFRKLNLNAVSYLLKLAGLHLLQVAKCRRQKWWGYSKEAKDIATYLLSNRSH